MKTLLALSLALTGFALVSSSDRSSASVDLDSPSAFACGCADMADLSERLTDVNAVIQALSPQINKQGSDASLTPAAAQKLDALIKEALTGSSTGRSSTSLPTINSTSCTITSVGSASSCMGDAMKAHFENQIDACPGWRSGGGMRFGYSIGDAASEEVTSYDNERAFIESQIERLIASGCQRAANNARASQPKAGLPNAPSAQSAPISFAPPMMARNLAPRSGVVRYILHGEAAGSFTITADSPIPFKVDTDGRVTGHGTIKHKASDMFPCKVRSFNGDANVTVSGRLDGDILSVTFAPTGSQGDLGELIMDCKVANNEWVARNFPFNPVSFRGAQKLRVPVPPEQYTVINVGMDPSVLREIEKVKKFPNPLGPEFVDLVAPNYKITLVTYYKR